VILSGPYTPRTNRRFAMVAQLTVVAETTKYGHMEFPFPNLEQAEHHAFKLQYELGDDLLWVGVTVDCPRHGYSTVYMGQCEACYDENLSLMGDIYNSMT
jgi:hypothetical protein